jgi:hypothetical protein
MNFQVEAGIPQVTNRGGRGRKPTAFPLADMDIGDSFLIQCDPNDKKAVDSWRRKLLVAKKRIEGGEWTTAKVSDGIRVWRTA